MKLRELYFQCRDMLEKAGADSPAFDSAAMCEDLAGIRRGAVRLMPDSELSAETSALVLAAAKRRAAGEPLQYILGEWEFYGLPFKVGPGVLIPRPETELLVDTVLKFLEGAPSPAIADLCSGSGCIAIALAARLPGARLYALERSPVALDYLRKNIVLNAAANVTPLEADVLNFSGELPLLDCVVSNPPYVKSGDIPGLARELSYEPEMALDGGADGLDFYRAIVESWGEALRSGGLFAFEIGEDEGDAVCELLARAGCGQVSLLPDCAGLPRVVTALRP